LIAAGPLAHKPFEKAARKMNSDGPLSRFPLISTTKIGELEEAFNRISIDTSVEINGRPEKFEGSIRNCQLQHIGLAYEKYSGARLNISETIFFSQAFLMGGGAGRL